MRLLRGGPRAVGEIAAEIEVTQQAASQHLAVLSKAGLVEARREGTRALYSIKPEGFAPVAAFVESFWGGKLAALKREIESEPWRSRISCHSSELNAALKREIESEP